MQQQFSLSQALKRPVRRRSSTHVSARLLAGWLLALCLSIPAVNAVAKPDEVRLQLKWHHQFQFAGYYAAQAKGFYADEGLQVDIIEGEKNRPPLKVVLSGAADYGVADSDIVLARMQGQPVVVVAAIFQHSPYVIMSRKDRKIQALPDLLGKTLMLSNDQGATQFRAMLMKEDIDPARIKILPHSWNLDDLITGKVDAISAYATVEPAKLQARGVEPAILGSLDYGVDFYGDTLFTTTDEILNHPKRVRAFLRATQKGWNYALSHPQEIADLILKMDGVSKRGVTRETLLKEAHDMQPYILSDVVEVGHMNLGRWQHIAETLVALKVAPEKQYDLSEFMYQPNKIDNPLLVQVLVVIALFVLAAIAIISLWNLQMRRRVRQRTQELQQEIQRREQIELALETSQELVRSTFRAAATGISMSTVHGEFLLANPAYCAIVGYGEEELRGMDFLALTYPDDRQDMTAQFDQLVAGEIDNLATEKRYITKRGEVIWVRLSISLWRAADGKPNNIISITEDITQAKRLEVFKVQQNGLLQQIAADTPLSEIFDAAVNLVEQQYPAALCSIMVLSNDGRSFKSGVSHRLADDYLNAILGVEIGPNTGSCGTAAHEGRNVIVNDIQTDPLWENYRDLANTHGLRACWSSPIFSSKKQVLGTFAVYSLQPYTPTQAEIDLVASCSNIVGIAIERYKAHEHLNLLENSIARLNDIILISEAEPFDKPGPRILFVNDAFERITGYKREEVIGQTPRILQGPKTQQSELQKIRQALKAWQPVRAEVINYKKNGEEIWLELDIVPIADASGWYTHWVAVERDVTQRKQAESKIQQLAFYDSMTGLPNRLLLVDRLEKIVAVTARTGHTGAVLFIDLDNFKSLNDTYGHDVGDLLLVQVATRILNCVRESDTVGRLGGDEFVVILNELDEDLQEAAAQAKNVCEKILISFNQAFYLDGYEHHSTPSIGVTLFNASQPTTVDELLRRADLAMYQAKASGRNIFRFFDPAMQAIINNRVTLEDDLRQGIMRNEFMLYYQAQYNSRGQQTGAEALIRWKQAKRGMVSPAQFIPLAEDTGLILPLGQWVLATACKQLLRWAEHKDTEHLTLAVNVSARQFRQADFVEQVSDLLDNTGANPARLKLELTESLLVENVEDIITKMSLLKAKGVGFSLDDFGTGYSSLTYLKRLPLDQLKIDQSFVRDVMVDNNDASIVRTIIALGQSLGLAVIAEGVETEEQMQFLIAHGCLAYQGYLFSKPVPIEEFEAALRNPLVRAQ